MCTCECVSVHEPGGLGLDFLDQTRPATIHELGFVERAQPQHRQPLPVSLLQHGLDVAVRELGAPHEAPPPRSRQPDRAGNACVRFGRASTHMRGGAHRSGGVHGRGGACTSMHTYHPSTRG